MAFALLPEVPAHVAPPALVAPAPREVSFGRIAGTVGRGTDRVIVSIDGKPSLDRRVARRRFAFRLALPPRDVAVRIEALDALGNRAGRTVAPVFGLPPRDVPRATRPYEDGELARELDELVRRFNGISAVYVENLRTGAGAAWNARARFPAASTVKLAIAIEVLRSLVARPPPGSELDGLLERMLVASDNEAANELLAWLGGSDAGGAARVNELLAALGLGDSELYGGFFAAAGHGDPIPLRIESEPAFEGKYTTAWDLARLHRFLHLAAGDRGPLLDVSGSFTGADARFLLYVLAHSADHGKLDRYLPPDVVVPHKAGWITEARHDCGVVYAPSGAFVAAVMTWTGAGAGDASDELAGRVAKLALDHFRAPDGRSASGIAYSFSL